MNMYPTVPMRTTAASSPRPKKICRRGFTVSERYRGIRHGQPSLSGPAGMRDRTPVDCATGVSALFASEEVFDGRFLEELAEPGHLLFLVLVLEVHGGLVEHARGGEYGHPGAHREGDGVGGA